VTRVRGQPPGRAGQTWLRRRLGAAQRSSALLDRRLAILRGRQAQFSRRADETRAVLDRLVAEAERAALRAALALGETALQPPADAPPAEVDVEWAALIGTRLPSAAQVSLPEASRLGRVPSGASAVLTARAYRDLLGAAVQHAVAVAAQRVVDDEIATTRFRLRAIEDRWIPRLQQAQTVLALALAEDESGEAVRIRWATGGRSRTGESRKVAT
jgi:V/A-type H+-transporting ATPase subunit D